LQAPAADTLTPADAALQALSYVLPSQPHTGADISVHTSGFLLQVPDTSGTVH
jgi:hypothetical protein